MDNNDSIRNGQSVAIGGGTYAYREILKVCRPAVGCRDQELVGHPRRLDGDTAG